jgi:hypothetical protein
MEPRAAILVTDELSESEIVVRDYRTEGRGIGPERAATEPMF